MTVVGKDGQIGVYHNGEWHPMDMPAVYSHISPEDIEAIASAVVARQTAFPEDIAKALRNGAIWPCRYEYPLFPGNGASPYYIEWAIENGPILTIRILDRAYGRELWKMVIGNGNEREVLDDVKLF